MCRRTDIAFLIVASFAAAAACAGEALAQKRVALVIGTDKYDNLDKAQQLQRAVNDARAVGTALKALGFDVIAAENLTRAAFNDQFQKFLDKLARGDTAAMYYAGHGVEIEGLNFLLPRDVPNVRFGRQEQVKRESLSVAEILLDLRSRNPEITLVILDACRDNPLVPEELRSAGATRGGLAPLKGEAPRGTFIMYSAAAGESALDRLPGNDPDRINSIFTRKLVPLLATKGLALHDMARQLRADVIELAATVQHKQVPAYYDGVISKYCLAGCDVAAEAAKRIEPATASQRVGEAAEAWGALRNATNVTDLEAFAARYKDTYFADLAKARIEELKKQQVAIATPVKPATPTVSVACDGVEAQVGSERRCLKPGAGKTDWFKDCPTCPEMVVAPAGRFTMGSPTGEPERFDGEDQLPVAIGKPFAVGRHAVTRGEFAAFVAATGHKTDGGCWGLTGSEWKEEAGRNWRSPGFTQNDRHPVVCVTWNDAKAFAAWLSSSTGKRYRLLSEAEREYVARAGSTTPFWWGTSVSTSQANYHGDTTYAGGSKGEYRKATVAVDSFAANAWGLHNVHGNVWDWTEDCWNPSNAGNPGDGTARTTGDCNLRVLRGGSWSNIPQYLRSAIRFGVHPGFRRDILGFRVARTLSPP